jgi:hemoglobin-like flavoprotein
MMILKNRRLLHSNIHFFLIFFSCYNSLFELDAGTKAVFGLPKDFDLTNAQGLKKMGALIHAKRMIAMLDSVLDMLGPDQDLFTDLYVKLGKQHAQYGVKSSYFALLGEALLIALAETLGPSVWSFEVEEAWTIVYGELCSGIVESMPSSSSS